MTNADTTDINDNADKSYTEDYDKGYSDGFEDGVNNVLTPPDKYPKRILGFLKPSGLTEEQIQKMPAEEVFEKAISILFPDTKNPKEKSHLIRTFFDDIFCTTIE